MRQPDFRNLFAFEISNCSAATTMTANGLAVLAGTDQHGLATKARTDRARTVIENTQQRPKKNTSGDVGKVRNNLLQERQREVFLASIGCAFNGSDRKEIFVSFG